MSEDQRAARVFAELNPWYDANREMMATGSINLAPSRITCARCGPICGCAPAWGWACRVESVATGNQRGQPRPVREPPVLGLVWYLSDRTALTIDAFDLAIAAPQLTGWPVSYAQHRFSVGLSF